MMAETRFQAKDTNPYPWWAPRFWHGMLFTDWMRMLVQHRCRVHPARWGVAMGVTLTSTFNSKMRLAQTALLGHRIKDTPIPRDPVFILGHWRSGTTLLHELLSVDRRFATPTTYQCFAANHFLLTEPVITRLFWFLMPSKRPMDNMAAGWHEPQEDEFALCAMGAPSPYLRMAFPNTSSDFLEYLDVDQLDPPHAEQWVATLQEFLRRLALHRVGKRIVLKSPTHTARLGLLASTFPDAKFIHMVRNPYDLVPSTVRLWNSLNLVQGLQIPQDTELEEYIYRTYECMYGAFARHRGQLTDDRIIEVHYEDLVQDATNVVGRIYDQLELGDFDLVRPELEQKLDSKRNYQKNQHRLNDAMLDRINQRWSDYFERYGYELRS